MRDMAEKDGISTSSTSSSLAAMRAVPAVNSASVEDGDTGRMASLRRGWKAYSRGTVYSSIFTLLTTCIGAGSLSLPYAFAQGGLVAASVVFLVIMLISVIVGFMLLGGKRYCAEIFPKMEVWGYEDLAQASFGAVGKIAVLITLIVLLFLALIAYMIYTRDQLDMVVQFILNRAGYTPDCSPLVNCALLMAIAFIPLFPITLLRVLTPLQFTSTLSVICITYVAIVMTVEMSLAWVYHGSNSTHHEADLLPKDHTVYFWPREFTGILTSISYCSLAFICHFNLLPLQKELHNPTKRRLDTIVIGTMLIAYTLYNIIIFSGYFTFFDTTMTDIILNYPRDDVLITTVRAALFFTLLCHYPVLLHPTRAAINRLLAFIHDLIVERLTRTRWNGNGDEYDDGIGEQNPLLRGKNSGGAVPQKNKTKEVGTVVWVLETWVLFGATFLPASFVPNVGYVWNFVGSIGGTLILYIFPAACYLRLRYLRYRYRSKVHRVTIYSQYNIYAIVKEVIAWLILGLGLVLLIVENYQAIDAVISATHTPSSLCFQSKCGTTHIHGNNTALE